MNFMRDQILLTTVFISLLGYIMPRKVDKHSCLVVEQPEPCLDDDITIYLFTRENDEDGQQVTVTETLDNLNLTNFNPLLPNKLMIHGFLMHYTDMDFLKSAYLKQGEYNIWMVDYLKLAKGPYKDHAGVLRYMQCYWYVAHYNVPHVGHCLAHLITVLRHHSTAPIHVLGFSLGAHVSNYIANKLAELGSHKLNRITGLDPAGPCFRLRNIHDRLDPSDADFVDVVHTEGLWMGYLGRRGHIDFYMNGGFSQPPCLTSNFGVTNTICNHFLAVVYFVESIRTPLGFLGWQCKNYAEYMMGQCNLKSQLVPMGEHCPHRMRGTYIVHTADQSPYALGDWRGETFLQRAPMHIRQQNTLMSKLPVNKINQYYQN